ncbi:MAG: hypothetical protein AAGJ83_09700 [Planctomycetota bacterium]
MPLANQGLTSFNAGFRVSSEASSSMDKKQKKRLEVINKKLTNLRQQLSGSREQADDLSELKELEDTISKLEAEAAEIKAAK